MDALIKHTAFGLDRIYKAFEKPVSSAISVEPQQPMCRYPDLVEGLSPAADTGTAGVGVLSDREHLRMQPPYERFIAELYELLSNDRFDEAHDLVRAERRAINGR